MKKLTALVLMMAMILNSALVVFADDSAPIEIKFENVITGKATFDADNSPGYDKDGTNNTIRTLDSISYEIHYSVKNENQVASGAAIRCTLPLGSNGEPIAVWDSSLVTLPNMTILDSGRTFEYRLGDVPGGSAYTFTPSAKILGNAAHGESLPVYAELVTQNLGQVKTATHTSVVSALPKVDLSVDSYRMDQIQLPTGEWGYLIGYGIMMNIAGGVGGESLKDDVTFDADLSQFGIPNAKLYSVNGSKAVSINGDEDIVDSAPLGKLGNDSNPNKCVANSGTVTVSQTKPGGNIAFTVSGMDSTGNHAPTMVRNGSAVPNDSAIIFSGYLKLFVAQDDLVEGQNPTHIELKNLTLTGLGGTKNFGTGDEKNLSNNVKKFDLQKQTAGNGRISFRVDYIENMNRENFLPTMTGWSTGDGTIITGQEFASRTGAGNSGQIPLTDVILLNKFDSKVAKLKPNETTGLPYELSVENGTASDWAVEYGVGQYADYDAMVSGTGEDKDSEGGIWYANLEDALKAGDVTKVRAKLKTGKAMTNGQYLKLKLAFEASSEIVGDKAVIYGAVKAKEVYGGTWNNGGYNALTNENAGGGQRLFITRVLARIQKSTTPDPINSILMTDQEQTVTYQLTPTFTSDPKLGTGVVAKTVVIEDFMPAGMTYVAGSANVAPEVIRKEADGKTYLKWILGDVPINSVMPAIHYKGVLDFDLKNQTILDNKAIISTTSDSSSELKRTAKWSIRVTNNRAWSIKEYVKTPLVEINEPIAYVLEYANFIAQDIKGIQFISKMPNASNSDFTGQLLLDSIETPNGETVFVTTDAPTSIQTDPSKNTNQWTAWNAFDITKRNSITGIKVAADVLPMNTTTRSIVLNMMPSANRGGDVYNHQTGGISETVTLPISSKTVSARVIASKIGQYVWLDDNKDGVRDAAEKGVANVKLRLTANDGSVYNTITDSNGYYNFANLHSGAYTVVVDATSIPKGYELVSEPDSVKDGITQVNLNKDTAYMLANFGYAKVNAPTPAPTPTPTPTPTPVPKPDKPEKPEKVIEPKPEKPSEPKPEQPSVPNPNSKDVPETPVVPDKKKINITDMTPKGSPDVPVQIVQPNVKPNGTATPSVNVTSPAAITAKIKLPQTGEAWPLYSYSMGAALIALGFALSYRKRNK